MTMTMGCNRARATVVVVAAVAAFSGKGRKVGQSIVTEKMRHGGLQLVHCSRSLGFPSDIDKVSSASIVTIAIVRQYSRYVIVNELLREVIDNALDSAAQAFGAARFAGFDFAFDLVPFAFGTWSPGVASINQVDGASSRFSREWTYMRALWRS